MFIYLHKNVNNNFFFLSPDLTGTALDYESGLTMVYLPNPSNVVDQTQAKLTQCILDKLGCGLEIGVSGYVVYGHRQGEVKAFWSFSRFDQMKQPQEILKLQPQPLYLLKDFIQGTYTTRECLSSATLYLEMSNNISQYYRTTDIIGQLILWADQLLAII